MCRGVGRLVHRHNAVRDRLFNLARAGGLAPRREEPHLLDGSEDRPADILLPAWAGGRDLCVDVAVVSPFAANATSSSESATTRAERRKMERYTDACAQRGLLFQPFVMDTLGAYGSQSHTVLRRIAAAIADVERSDILTVLPQIRQSLSFAAQKALAEGFLSRFDC